MLLYYFVEYSLAIAAMFVPPIDGYPSVALLALCVTFTLATLFSNTACERSTDMHYCGQYVSHSIPVINTLPTVTKDV